MTPDEFRQKGTGWECLKMRFLEVGVGKEWPQVVFVRLGGVGVTLHVFFQLVRGRRCCQIYSIPSRREGRVGRSCILLALGKEGGKCSLSLRRAACGSKRMFLELIHGLFIT